MLLRLPPVERARAARWLTGVRVALHARGHSPVIQELDVTLDVLFRLAATEIPGPDRLRLVTIRPPAGQAEALRRALDPEPAAFEPAPGDVGSRLVEPVGGQPPEHDQDFGDRLREAYRSTLDFYTQKLVTGRRAEDRGPGRLYSMAHLQRIAAAARWLVDGVFGQLVPERVGVSISVHDQWEDRDRLIRNWSQEEQRAQARRELIGYLTQPTDAAALAREHRAVPDFDRDGAPLNEESRIISAVIEDLLNDPAIVAQALDLLKAWPAWSDQKARKIWVQRFRADEPWQNQRELWDKLVSSIHEYVHTLVHPRFRRLYRELPPLARNALEEGVVCLLTEIVWSGVWPWDPALREAVEGEYATEPPLPMHLMPHPFIDHRYESIAQVKQLLALLGDVRNLYAAFFLGEVEMIGWPAFSGGTRRITPDG